MIAFIPFRWYGKRNIQGANRYDYTNKNDKNISGSAMKCHYYGRELVPWESKCPGTGKKCIKCKQSNNFANVCKSTQRQVVHAFSESNDRGIPVNNRIVDESKHDVLSSKSVYDSDYVFSINSGKKGLPTEYWEDMFCIGINF
jgi:hypothetical protein